MNEKKAFPITALCLILINVVIFVLLDKTGGLESTINAYAMRPAAIARGENLVTLFTSMFLHGSYGHLIGNMLFLLVFGVILERRFGAPRFLLLYFIAGIVASLFEVAVYSDSWVRAYGASGAISGVVGACLAGLPTARAPLAFLIFISWPFFSLFLPGIVSFFAFFMLVIPAIVLALTILAPLWPFVLLWIIYQLVAALKVATLGIVGGVAYWAHIAGFLAGMLLCLPIKPKMPSERVKPREEIPAIG